MASTPRDANADVARNAVFKPQYIFNHFPAPGIFFGRYHRVEMYVAARMFFLEDRALHADFLALDAFAIDLFLVKEDNRTTMAL